LWGERFTGPGDDVGQVTTFSKDGSVVFVAGSSSFFGRFGLISYDATTGVVDGHFYGSNYTNGFEANAIALSSDGKRLYVGGAADFGSVRFVVYMFDLVHGGPGACQMYRRGPGDSVVTAIAVSPDNSKLFAVGYGTASVDGRDYVLWELNATNCHRIWKAVAYNGPGNGDDTPTAIGVSPDGSKVFVTGYSQGASDGYDYATIAYDTTTGKTVWIRRFDGPVSGDDRARALGVSPDGSTVYVAGSVTEMDAGIRPNTDFGVVAYNASNGTVRWTRFYRGVSQDYPDDADGLVVSPDGSHIIVTGSSTDEAGANLDYATVAWGPTGAWQWASRYNGHDNMDDSPTSLAINPDGSKVFVTGWSTSAASGKDYATLAYDTASGGWVWRRLNNGLGNGDDIANAIAVSPDGSKIAVTGSSTGSGTGTDWSTIAYTTG
jgi:hypothetical protein